ncbi:MAG: hypothetical protein KBC42_00760 [Candidatus Pacebacteria bacterium]|nr:hypothetical protein [Candidatus Paceibacterota bacterium]MBP9780439.1 hypothetical protein [Candidatus Paceibacterota bacterium]
MKTKNVGPHYAAENREWRAFVKYGLPGIIVLVLSLASFHGLASKYPALLVISLVVFLAGLYFDGKKSVHTVAMIKIINVLMVFIAVTLLTGNALFAVVGISTSFVLAILILQKT